MLLLAVAVVALREAGTAVGWGFQLQEPVFLLGVSALLVLFALNLFGVFEIGAPGGLAEVGSNSSGAARSFFEGFLAVALATPCSAPFLGTAVGFAFTTSNFATISVFLVVGLGLAAPFVAVSAAPNLSRFLPRPGPWMVHLRTFLGFCLLGSVVWLLWVLGQVTAAGTPMQALVWLLVLAVCAWLYGLGQRADSSKLRPVLITVALGALLAGPGLIRTDPSGQSAAETATPRGEDRSYSAERLAEGLEAGRSAFVYFTADWCVTCKVNERRVLKDLSIRDALTAQGFDVLRADMTRRDPELLATLKRYGRAGVPLYLVFRPGQAEPTVLPDLLSKEIVLAVLHATRTTTAHALPGSL
jgi:thiol:disulfide interchange protein DsbD